MIKGKSVAHAPKVDVDKLYTKVGEKLLNTLYKGGQSLGICRMMNEPFIIISKAYQIIIGYFQKHFIKRC